MTRVLVISRYFPPLNSAGGSIRLVKFLKYISSWGWKFVVFTQDAKQTVVPEYALSSFLLDELPSEVEIRRVSAPFSISSSLPASVAAGGWIGKLVRRILGDSSMGWGTKVFWNSLKDIRKLEVDLVFGVAPPFANALIAMLLGWVGRKPFVLDLKDDWVGSPTFLQKNVIKQKLETLLENLIVRRASAVITVTPQSYRLYEERYKQLSTPEKFHLIPNGCDLDEYDHLGEREKQIASTRFMILSAAWGYRRDYRDISSFLLGLDKFFRRFPDAREKVDVVLLGESISSEYNELISDLRLNEIIHRIGAVKRSDLVEWLWKADLFLLIQPVHNTTAISGTLYEYWATGKAPILLISEDGASSALIEENHLGKRFCFDQLDQIADYIEENFAAYEAGQPIWIDRHGVQNFDREKLAKRMETIWGKVLLAK